MTRTITVTLGVAVAGGALVTYLNRAELNRYRRILQMDENPELVGASVTPQGNTFALDHSQRRRRRNRQAGSIAPSA